MTQVAEIIPMENDGTFILHTQYHNMMTWWPNMQGSGAMVQVLT